MNKNIISPSILHTALPDNENSGTITFEVPLNQRSRSLLRLERIFRETKRHIKITTPSAHFFALKQIFLLLDFFERTDFKAELIKELDREIAYFAKLAMNPDVDLTKLEVFINQLGQLSTWFRNQTGKIGHQLLQQEFLANARQKLTIGSARLSFDAPFVKLFLAMPIPIRQEKLLSWLSAFKGIQTSVEVLLRLSRESGSYVSLSTQDGFFQQTMEKNEYQFIGIRLPIALNVFPEVSSGPNRFSIHFMLLSDELETRQVSRKLTFELVRYI